jgi:RNA polymerase sigma factor (sigma-70 family)
MENPLSFDHIEIKNIYKSCSKQVYAMVMKNSGSFDDARDIFQETMIALFENVNKGAYQPTANICTYLYRIAYNKWMKALRENEKKATVLMDEVPDLAYDPLTGDEHLNSRYSALENCMKKLDERSRKMIQLSAENVKDKDAATELGFTSDGYYRIALMRIKEKLIECLNKNNNAA